MLPHNIIQNVIQPVMTSYTGEHVLSLMDEARCSHLPIVNNQDFLGLISENDLFNNNLSDPIGTYRLYLTNPFVRIDNHLYDAIRIICINKLSLVPVIDSNNVYLGYIDLLSIIEYLGNNFSINNPGAIIELELNVHDFSLSEIIHIIESNDAKLLNLAVTTIIDSTRIRITIKLNKIDISGIIQALNRYEYVVFASYGENIMQDYFKDRYDFLMNYLNV